MKRSEKLSRPPLERMLKIHEALQQDRYPNCSTISRNFEVSTKTIKRDIGFMRDNLNLPIEFDRSVNGYRYTEAVESFPTVSVSEGEVVAMLVAQKAMEQYHGTPFQKPLETAFKKLTSSLTGSIRFSLGNLDQAIAFKPLGIAKFDLEIFEGLSKAILSNHTISFKYKKLAIKTTSARKLHPYQMVCANNQWYLIGLDIDINEIRIFALPRISAIKTLKQTFQRPDDFSVNDHLKNSMGIFTGEKTQLVTIVFDRWAAGLVKEKTWHEDAIITEKKDGTLVFKISLSNLHEIHNWVLQWGEHAEVKEPKELRSLLKESAKNLLNMYNES